LKAAGDLTPLLGLGRSTRDVLAVEFSNLGQLAGVNIERLVTRPRTVDLYYDVVLPDTEWPTRDFSIRVQAAERRSRHRIDAAANDLQIQQL